MDIRLLVSITFASMLLLYSCNENPTNSASKINIETGLIAYYPFNGNANDSTGNGNNGIVHGAQLFEDRNGNPHSAYYFNGDLAYIDLGNSIKLKRYRSDYSVTGWIYLNQYPSTYNSIILSNRNTTTPSTSGSFIGVGGMSSSLSKRIEFIKNATVTDDIYSFDYLSSNTQLELKKWYFFAVTYKYNGDSSNIVKIYIDGFMESQKKVGETLDPLNVNTYLGCEPALYPIDYSFNGIMDEIRIYDRVLGDNEINELYLIN